jgi:hypothetical protein
MVMEQAHPGAGILIEDIDLAKPITATRSGGSGISDDAVMAFEDFLDAKRVLGVLGKRLARYGLTLHPDKTRFVDSATTDQMRLTIRMMVPRSLSSASPTYGVGRGQVRMWCDK